MSKIADSSHEKCQEVVNTLLEVLCNLRQNPHDLIAQLDADIQLAKANLLHLAVVPLAKPISQFAKPKVNVLYRCGVAWERDEIESRR